MRANALILLAAVGLFGIGNQDEPGWLSTALASTDPDVEAAIQAYEAGEFDTAAERLDAAVARRGERAELYYDRGLVLLAQGDHDAARAAFEHGTESSDVQVRASSHYELGNLAMAAEDWQAAIEAYIECLRAQPDHENAKWNLELALQRKQEQEEKDKQEQEEQEEQDKQDGEDGEQGEEGEDGEQDEQDEQDGEQEQDQEQDQQDGEDGEQDQQEQDKPDEQPGEDGEQDQQEQEQEQQQPEPEPGEQQEAQPQPIESGDLDSALDELDRRDAFMFGRPRGSNREVEKDW
ncbi:tetratricopeptide repeat protein [Enhygromyxa salina]|uniref:Lipoprotein NlpI n=1 Tax=Enhygromyxa salina TaxID=215803 RepID=A0A2S9XTV6_9BACT|nr:tetratricopeptide repeat protein [Enhygromyxa salina]PRP96295.1 lipoprotein NlpI [Enhygromyxa salina]